MKKLLLMILALAFALSAGAAFAATGEVTYRLGPDEDFTTIADILADAEEHYDDEDDEDPDTVTVIKIILADDITEDFETLTIDEDSSLTQLTIQGDGHTINAPSAARHFVLNKSGLALILQNLTLAGNEDDGGGGIWLQAGTLTAANVRFTGNDAGVLEDEEDTTGGALHITGSSATATLTGCTFTANSSTTGGAIHAAAGTLTISGGTFSGNGAATDNTDISEYGGAIYIASGASVTISGSPTFTGNTASASGGAVYALSSLTLNSGTFTDNTASISGGAVYTYNSTLNITGGTFTGNSAAISGGAVHNENSVLTISGASFTNTSSANTAFNGGAVYTSGGSLTITSTTFNGNTSADLGGALYAAGAVNLGDSIIFSGNHANNGGAMYIADDAEIASSGSVSFTRNSAVNGGALWAYSGEGTDGLTSALTFTSNTADYGGAVYVYEQSSSLVLDSTKPWVFTGNTANYDGGAVFTLSADVVINGIEISGNGNTAVQGGGFLRSGGTATISNASISGQNAHFGGAVYSVGTVNISNSTFSGNTAEATSGNINGGGGAVYVQGDLTVSSSDFSNNSNTSVYGNHGGGAIFVSGDAEIEGSSFTGNIHQNSATNNTNGGGAIYAHGTLTVTSSKFTSNSAAGSSLSRGGAIYADSSNIGITDSLFQSNKSAHNGGAAVFAGESTSTIESSTFNDNVSTSGYGGAVYAQGNFSVKTSYFYLNRSYAYGGAIYFNQHNNISFGSFSAETSYFAMNSAGIAPSQNGFGGALYLSPETASINRCTFDSNQVSSSNGQSYGAGVYIDISESISATTSTIKNSVFFSNTASDGATNYGGAVYAKGDISLISDTIANNAVSGTAARGGGVYADTGTLTVTASIIVGNTGNIGRDVYAEGTITSRGYNRIGVYGKGGSNTAWIADVSGSTTDRENSAWSTATFFGANAQLVTEYGSYTIPTVGESSSAVLLPALVLSENENLAQEDRATNMIPYARRYTLNIEQYDIWGIDRFAAGTDISLGAVYFGGDGGGSGTAEGSFDIASIIMSGVPNTLKYPGQTASLIAMVRYSNGRVAYGVPYDAVNITLNQQERVTWHSSNPSAVAIDKYGNITALSTTSTSGVNISVKTVRYTTAGSQAEASTNIILVDTGGSYEYMNISPSYYTYITQVVLPDLFEYDLSAAIADKNPSTIRSAAFQRNFSAVWAGTTASQITDLTTSTPTITAATSIPSLSGMAASKRAGVSINYQNRDTGELFPVTYSWTFTGKEISAVLGYDLSGRNINSSLAEAIFEKFSIACQGINQVIPVIGGSGVSGKDAYDYGVLELTKADGNAGLHVSLTVYLGNLAVTGNSDGAQIVRSSGTTRVLVVPDGAADGAVAGSMWMFQPSGTNGGGNNSGGDNSGGSTKPGTSTDSNSGGGGGGGGCDSVGLGLLGAIVLLLKRRQ